MTAIRLDGFAGLAPIFDPRKLPESAATVARDCVFDGSDIVPLNASVAAENVGITITRLFKYRFQGQSMWLAWPSPWDVDPVVSPIPQDSLGRLYWSRVDPATINSKTADNYPRAASQPTQAAITANSPAIVRRLGVPQPVNKPTVAEVQKAMSVSSATTPKTLTAMSKTSPVTVTAVGHPFKDGWRVAVSAENGTDEGMKELVGLEFVVGNVKADSFDLRNSDGANYTAFTANTKLKISRVYGVADVESRAYVSTWVTDWGEEGMPSPPSVAADVRYDSTVNVTVDRAVPAWAATFVNRIRIYRTATGSSTNFFFVKEVASGLSGAIVDDVQPAGLGEMLPSATWAPAPNGLRGLVAMPNGFMAGFIGNTVYFSEPYQPHAWPDEYRKTTQDDIVGMAVYGQTLVIATKGKPYLASGTDPLSVSLQQLDLDAPCLNKGGICSTGTSVLYPTPDGLASVTAGGAQLLTQQHVTKKQWADLWDSQADAIFHDTRYIAFARSAGKRTLIAQYNQATGLLISDATLTGRAPAVDPDDDTLHYASGSTRMQFGAGAALTADWQSKVFTAPHAVNMSFGRVFATGYPVTMVVRYANLRANGQPGGEVTDSFTVTVNGPEPFRLPGGFLSREWQVNLRSAFPVQQTILTDETDALR